MAVNNSNINSLSQKQLLFANLYLESCNATKSYIQAYGDASDEVAAAASSRLLKNVKVRTYLEKMRAKAAKATIATVTEVQEELTRFMANADLHPKERLKAMDMLIHSQGGYSDKVTVDGNINNPLSGFTTEELKALIDK